MKHINEYINEAMAIRTRKIGKGWIEVVQSPFIAQVLAFDEPSEEYGINGGKISKLEIIRAGRKNEGSIVICRYDRGWDTPNEKEPDMDVVAKAFYDELIKRYN